MNDRIKVLIVDDSAIYRQILSEVIGKISDAECIGTAASGKIALRKVESLRPDLVLLDIVMPELDGVETLCKIKQAHPEIQAVMISKFDMDNAKATLKSLDVGALDFVAKPADGNSDVGAERLKNRLTSLIDLVIVKKFTGRISALQKAPPASVSPRYRVSPADKKSPALILIGVSTGGPKALARLVPAIGTSVSCPILVVQHMPPLFTKSLAEKLQQKTALKVVEAKNGEAIQPKTVYIAPGGRHMLLREKYQQGDLYLAISDTPPVNNCRPSADVLFRSVAGAVNSNILAVIMTGMGRDGTEGIRMLKRKGCRCLIQDEASSVVWGMPGSIHEAGLADEVLPLDQLGRRITELASQNSVSKCYT